MALCLAGFVGDDTVRVVFLSIVVWPEMLGILVAVDKILLVLMKFTLFPLFVGTVLVVNNGGMCMAGVFVVDAPVVVLRQVPGLVQTVLSACPS